MMSVEKSQHILDTLAKLFQKQNYKILHSKIMKCEMYIDFNMVHVMWKVRVLREYEGLGTSLVVQWLRLPTPNAGGLGSIPGQGTRLHMPQLKIPHTTMKIPSAETKIQCSQINKFFF